MATATFQTNPDFDGAAAVVGVFFIAVIAAAVNKVVALCALAGSLSRRLVFPVTPPPEEREADNASG